jgi:hypothetical protein
MDEVSYEYTKKQRITAGALVMVASLGAGAVVMMTKSKSHWHYIDYHEQNVPWFSAWTNTTTRTSSQR